MNINIVMLLLAEYVIKMHLAEDRANTLEQQLAEANAEVEELKKKLGEVEQ